MIKKQTPAEFFKEQYELEKAGKVKKVVRVRSVRRRAYKREGAKFKVVEPEVKIEKDVTPAEFFKKAQKDTTHARKVSTIEKKPYYYTRTGKGEVIAHVSRSKLEAILRRPPIKPSATIEPYKPVSKPKLYLYWAKEFGKSFGHSFKETVVSDIKYLRKAFFPLSQKEVEDVHEPISRTIQSFVTHPIATASLGISRLRKGMFETVEYVRETPKYYAVGRLGGSMTARILESKLVAKGLSSLRGKSLPQIKKPTLPKISKPKVRLGKVIKVDIGAKPELKPGFYRVYEHKYITKIGKRKVLEITKVKYKPTKAIFPYKEPIKITEVKKLGIGKFEHEVTLRPKILGVGELIKKPTTKDIVPVKRPQIRALPQKELKNMFKVSYQKKRMLSYEPKFYKKVLLDKGIIEVYEKGKKKPIIKIKVPKPEFKVTIGKPKTKARPTKPYEVSSGRLKLVLKKPKTVLKKPKVIQKQKVKVISRQKYKALAKQRFRMLQAQKQKPKLLAKPKLKLLAVKKPKQIPARRLRLILLPKLKTKQKLKQKQKTKQKQIILPVMRPLYKVRLKPLFKPVQVQSAKLKSVTTPKVISIPKRISVTKQRQIPLQKPLQIVMPRYVMKPKLTKPKPLSKEIPRFSGAGGGKRRRKRMFGIGSLIGSYAPSIEALMFNIKSIKVPKVITGLEVRPIKWKTK